MPTLTMVTGRNCAGSSCGICLQRLTSHLRNHRLELLRALHLLQLSQKLIVRGKTEHISLLLDRGS